MNADFSDRIEDTRARFFRNLDQIASDLIRVFRLEFNRETQHLSNGISTLVCIDDNVYIGPGMGITSASTSLRVTDKVGRVLDWVDRLAAFADDENSQFQTEVRRLGVESPRFELSITPHGLAIFEEQTRIAFTFPKKPKHEDAVHSAKIVDLICPEWALRVISKRNSKTA